MSEVIEVINVDATMSNLVSHCNMYDLYKVAKSNLKTNTIRSIEYRLNKGIVAYDYTDEDGAEWYYLSHISKIHLVRDQIPEGSIIVNNKLNEFLIDSYTAMHEHLVFGDGGLKCTNVDLLAFEGLLEDTVIEKLLAMLKDTDIMLINLPRGGDILSAYRLLKFARMHDWIELYQYGKKPAFLLTKNSIPKSRVLNLVNEYIYDSEISIEGHTLEEKYDRLRNEAKRHVSIEIQTTKLSTDDALSMFSKPRTFVDTTVYIMSIHDIDCSVYLLLTGLEKDGKVYMRRMGSKLLFMHLPQDKVKHLECLMYHEVFDLKDGDYWNTDLELSTFVFKGKYGLSAVDFETLLSKEGSGSYITVYESSIAAQSVDSLLEAMSKRNLYAVRHLSEDGRSVLTVMRRIDGAELDFCKRTIGTQSWMNMFEVATRFRMGTTPQSASVEMTFRFLNGEPMVVGMMNPTAFDRPTTSLVRCIDDLYETSTIVIIDTGCFSNVRRNQLKQSLNLKSYKVIWINSLGLLVNLKHLNEFTEKAIYSFSRETIDLEKELEELKRTNVPQPQPTETKTLENLVWDLVLQRRFLFNKAEYLLLEPLKERLGLEYVPDGDLIRIACRIDTTKNLIK